MTGLVVFLVTLGVGFATFAVVNSCQRFGVRVLVASCFGSLLLKALMIFTAWTVMADIVTGNVVAILAGIVLMMFFEAFWWWRIGARTPLAGSGQA